MKRLLLILLTMLLGAGLVITGCDESSSDSEEKQIGTEDDPNFQFMTEMVGQGNFEHLVNLINISMALPMYAEDAAKESPLLNAADDGIVYLNVNSYDTSNYWHIFSCSVIVGNTDDSMHYGGIDSIRYGNGAGGYMYEPDSTTTTMDIRTHFDLTENSEYETVDVSNHASFVITGEYGVEEFSASGTSIDSVDIHFVGDSGECDLNMDYVHTLNDILIDEVVATMDGCPLTGTASFAYNVGLSCTGSSELDSLNVNGGWTADFVFNDGEMTYTYENATTRWTGTEQCRTRTTAKGAWFSALENLRNR